MSLQNNIIYGGDVLESANYPTFGDFLLKKFNEGGDTTAMIDGKTGESMSYRDLYSQCIEIAKSLDVLGVRQNDVVAIISENRLEYVPIALGITLLNALVAPISCSYTERELIHALNISKPKTVFISALSFGVIEVIKKLEFVELIILLNDDSNFTDDKVMEFKSFIKRGQRNSFDVEKFVKIPVKLKDQGAFMFLSSGTTGLPKGVEISQLNIIANTVGNSNLLRSIREATKNVVLLVVGPFSHAMGFFGTLFILCNPNQSSIVFLNKFEPASYLECIQKYKVTVLSAAPPILIFLNQTPLFANYNLSSLKAFVCGAAKISKQTEDQLQARFNQKIEVIQAYGQTETTLGVTSRSLDLPKPGSVGGVIKGTYIKVVDSDGKALGPNTAGELLVKGNTVMKGFYNNPQATAETIDKNGWLHTGDLGYYDEDLQFYIIDRLKELIKYKGFQVPPVELEGLIMTYPNVKDCGVIGIQDEKAGELPFAFVVKQPNAQITEREIKDFVAKNASNPKWLRGGVKFVEAIPKNMTGKILRRELRSMYDSMRAKL